MISDPPEAVPMKKKQRPSLDRKTDNTYDQGQGWTHAELVVIMKKKTQTGRYIYNTYDPRQG